MNSIDIKCLISDLDEQLEPLLKRRSDLSTNLRKAESQEFVRINRITKTDVQRCDDEGVPWMGDIYVFGKWISKNSDKLWCCWNGLLYLSSEIVAGRMDRDVPGMYEDLE